MNFPLAANFAKNLITAHSNKIDLNEIFAVLIKVHESSLKE
jgi:hypothetical protein